ncbi:hypothetical protein ACFQ88_27135 [Paenibacillus sp. NPDC056579]|uniref:hypothetical protein n=1 Tax=Paenibacillus sp. NPDC056579 TaxID=3345871 RepID=UPI003680FBE6
MNKTCTEITHYKLQSPADTELYLKAVDVLNRVLPQIKGFISRDVYYSSEAETWVEVIQWEDLPTAKDAEKTLMSMPECKEGFRLLNMETVSLHYYDKVSEFKIR